jgi:hypothetical protein
MAECYIVEINIYERGVLIAEKHIGVSCLGCLGRDRQQIVRSLLRFGRAGKEQRGLISESEFAAYGTLQSKPLPLREEDNFSLLQFSNFQSSPRLRYTTDGHATLQPYNLLTLKLFNSNFPMLQFFNFQSP